MMVIGIVGSSGYIANYLIDRFAKLDNFDVVKIDKTEESDIIINLEHAEKYDYSFLKKIDYLVFTAAISGPDQCATDFNACWNVNVKGTSYFINEALKCDCKVIFFSSDAVFGDVLGKIYDENSLTEAQTPYGKMKKAVEDEFKNNINFKSIRLSYVVSANDRFTRYCLQCINKNEVAYIFHPFYRNVIGVTDVINVVQWLVQNWNTYSCTFLNIAGIELISRVRIADEINRLFDGKLRYSISYPDELFFENRPKITQMKSLYLYEMYILKKETFTEKIQKELKEIKL